MCPCRVCARACSAHSSAWKGAANPRKTCSLHNSLDCHVHPKQITVVLVLQTLGALLAVVSRSQTAFARRGRVWSNAYARLVQNSPGTGRSIVAFHTLVTGQSAAYNCSLLAKAVCLRETSSYAASSLDQHDRRNS